MTAAAKPSIAFRLGRAAGAVVRFCLFDKNSSIRWLKRVVVFTAVALVLTSSLSAIVGSLLSAGCVGLLIWALSMGSFSPLSNMLKDDPQGGADDDSYRAPFYGEHEHPDYNLHFKD